MVIRAICALALLVLAAPAMADTAGSRLWADRYNGPANLNDSASSLAIGPRGKRVYVTGYSLSGPQFPEPFDSDYLTLAYRTSTGKALWRARFDGPAKSDDNPVAVVGPKDSRIYVTGTSFTGTDLEQNHDSDYVTVAYDARTGKKLWVGRYNGPADRDEHAASAALSPDGSAVYVTGSSETAAGQDYATVAYRASTGKELWAARYSGPGEDPDTAQSLAVSPDGSAVYVTGLTAGVASSDYGTVAYDAVSGAQRWVARYDGPAQAADEALSVLANPDGSAVYVTGESARQSALFDYATVAYSASTGDQLWVARYNGPGNRDDIAQDLAASPDGSRLYVTGESVGSSAGFDYATAAYRASTGNRLWLARFRGPEGGDDLARSVATSPNGSRVYVTGSAVFGTRDSPRIDYGTVAYRAMTGARRWVADYNGPANGADRANALVVNPDGSAVYVTGESDGVTTHHTPLDYATVAYRR